MPDTRFSIAVFPFLKTSKQVTIGRLAFRPTDDTDALEPEQGAAVREVANMLFVQGDWRVRSAACAVIPLIDLERTDTDTSHLRDLRAAVGFLYSRPGLNGTPFLPSESTALVLLTPGDVPSALVRPPTHSADFQGIGEVPPDGHQMGYTGLYDFAHYFWVAKGSRIYGLTPHPSLNANQDLASDVDDADQDQTGRLLFRALWETPQRSSSERIFTALRWYDAANRRSLDDQASIVHLAIAFESLLGLPDGEKSDRLADAIALLLGRVARLDVWARQFYAARSTIVHEGRSISVDFVATDSKKQLDGPRYASLLSYGRSVFRLCVEATLFGSHLAEAAGLEETLVANSERFVSLCRILSDTKRPAKERFEEALPLIKAIGRNRFFPDSGIRVETMTSAVRHLCRTFLELREAPLSEQTDAIQAAAAGAGGLDPRQQREIIRQLYDALTTNASSAENVELTAVRALVEEIWSYVFLDYFRDRDAIRGKPL